MVKSFGILKSIFLCFFIVLFSHISLYQTPLSGILFFVLPAMVSYAVFVLGIFSSSLLCLCACIFNAATAFLLPEISLYTSLHNTLVLILPGFICGLLITKKAKVSDIIIAVSFCVVIFPLISLGYAKYSQDFNLTKTIYDFLNEAFFEQFKLIKSLYPEAANVFGDNEYNLITSLSVVIPGVIPAIAITVSFFYSILIFMISKALLRKKLIENSFFIQGLECIYLPKINITILFVLILLLFLETTSFIMMAILNVCIILVVFFMIQGLSLIEYKLKQKNLNSFVRFLALTGIVIGLFVVSAIMPILNPIFSLSILGISDSSHDYRKINANEGDKNEI